MARSLTAGMIAAINAGSVYPVFFYEGQFSTGTLNLWTGLGEVVWDGKTWTGAGNMLAISPIQESTDNKAIGFSASLSGQLSSILSIAIANVRQGLPGSVWFATYDSGSPFALVTEPFLAFKGRLNTSEIIDEGENAKVSVNYESHMIDGAKTKERRYTPEDQKIDYSTDTGFEQVASLQDKTIVWGNR